MSEGWGPPDNTLGGGLKAHYFRNNRSLCGTMEWFGNPELLVAMDSLQGYHGEEPWISVAEKGNPCAWYNCAKCRLILDGTLPGPDDIILEIDTELREWVHNAKQCAGDFVKSIAEAAARADWQNYRIIRPALLELKKKYPSYAEESEFTDHRRKG